MTDPLAQIDRALVLLVRKATDPRGNRRINELAGADIERAGAAMLVRVSESEPARLSELARAAGVDISTASRQVAALVDAGFVRRRDDPTDRRAHLHELTDDGRALRERLGDARRRWIADMVAGLSDEERRVLGALLERVTEPMAGI
ncbi:MAG: MarR family transcriptional regulator [Actinomycetota bacterium]|nr:MarR family transcriptional regulator [Actinomycetota bacterium]